MIRILKKIISSNFIVSVLIVVSAILSCINKKVDYIEPYALIYHNLTPGILIDEQNPTRIIPSDSIYCSNGYSSIGKDTLNQGKLKLDYLFKKI